jgi:glyoxylase-like metal-dependent hydrolase (beta-lactamase superfamily II)
MSPLLRLLLPLRRCCGIALPAVSSCCRLSLAPRLVGRRHAHSTAAAGQTTEHSHGSFRVVQYPILADNYSWLVGRYTDAHRMVRRHCLHSGRADHMKVIVCVQVVHDATGEAVAVDPADAPRAMEVAESLSVTITSVLCTHHHADHAGGNESLAKCLPGLRVIGSAMERCPGATELVKDGK